MKTSDILKVLDEFIPNPKCSLNYHKDYELLIAVMLSAQSTDERVNLCTKELFKYNLKELANLDINIIENIIRPVGTYTRKARYLKDIATRLLNDNDGVVPNDREYIESLPGVGHKTCNVVLNELYNVPAIAVDTHVSRVSKRLGLTSIDSDVVKTEKDLMSLFPENSWGKVHLQLLLFGRHTCKSKKPLCYNCPFNNNLCNKKDLV